MVVSRRVGLLDLNALLRTDPGGQRHNGRSGALRRCSLSLGTNACFDFPIRHCGHEFECRRWVDCRGCPARLLGKRLAGAVAPTDARPVSTIDAGRPGERSVRYRPGHRRVARQLGPPADWHSGSPWPWPWPWPRARACPGRSRSLVSLLPW